MVLTRSKAHGTASSVIIKTEKDEPLSKSHLALYLGSKFNWFDYIGSTSVDEGVKKIGCFPQHEKKNLKDLITHNLTNDERRSILKLAGVVVSEESRIHDEVYSILSRDICVIEDLVDVGVLPYYPVDMNELKNCLTSHDTKCPSSLPGDMDDSLKMLEEEDPIIVPFTTEKLFAQYEENVPVADQILREMTVRKTRTGQRRVSKRSKRSKLSTSMYLSMKYGCDQEFHSTPASMRRFRSGTTPKKDSVLLRCPLKHRLLIKPNVDKPTPSAVASNPRARRRGTGRS